MKAHIIFINDDPKFVVLDNLELAKEKLEQLAFDHWDSNRWDGMQYESYREMVFWHIHTIAYC